MTPIRWDPDRRTLGQFSEAWMFFLGMVGAPMALWRGHPTLAAVLWALALMGRGVGLARPMWMRPVFVGMTLATWPIGWVVSNLLVGIVYYGTVVPIGLIRRALGADPLARSIDRSAPTYWTPVRPNTRPDRYFRQF